MNCPTAKNPRAVVMLYYSHTEKSFLNFVLSIYVDSKLTRVRKEICVCTNAKLRPRSVGGFQQFGFQQTNWLKFDKLKLNFNRRDILPILLFLNIQTFEMDIFSKEFRQKYSSLSFSKYRFTHGIFKIPFSKYRLEVCQFTSTAMASL